MLLFAASVSHAQSNTGSSTLSVTVGAEAAIVVATTPPFSSVGIFGNYTATTPFTYYVRTTSGGAGGAVTVEITTDFSPGGPGGGPSVTAPPTTGDLLTYACTVANAGGVGTPTACTGPMTASTAAATNVLTFAPGTQSAKTGGSGSTSWTLVNDPVYKAGTYSAVATYTISAA